MADKQRAKVTADIKQNRLYIALPGDASKMVLEKVYTDVRFCVADLKPGFDVVSDFSQCTIGHLNGIPILRKIMNYLVINQPREVVRVVGKRSLIFKQLMRLSSVLNGYKAIYVNTLEEAEEQLTHSTKRKGLRFQIHRPRVEYKRNQEGRGRESRRYFHKRMCNHGSKDTSTYWRGNLHYHSFSSRPRDSYIIYTCCKSRSGTG